MSFRTKGPRLGASTEKLEQCPYDACHWIRLTKLDDHIAKCRLNHEVDLAEKGKRPIVLSCQYNYLHQVVDIEWKYHCARCPDRKRLWSYQLKCENLKTLFPEILTITGGDIPPDKAERREMYSGLDEGSLWSNELEGHVKFKHIGKTFNEIAQGEAEDKAKALAEELENEWKPGMLAPGPPPRQPPPPPALTFEEMYTQEEIDEWNPPSTSKVPFSWMAYNSRPRGYVHNYPPGLNKKQRRLFEIQNAKEFEKKMAAKKKKEEEEAAKKEEGSGGEEDLKEEGALDSEQVGETSDKPGDEKATLF